jgi:hypothetical protein
MCLHFAPDLRHLVQARVSARQSAAGVRPRACGQSGATVLGVLARRASSWLLCSPRRSGLPHDLETHTRRAERFLGRSASGAPASVVPSRHCRPFPLLRIVPPEKPSFTRAQVSSTGERKYRPSTGYRCRRVLGGNARHPPRAPPLAVKLCPRVRLGPVHAWTARTRVQRPLRSATMLAVRHWLGFGSRNTAEGADTATSGGALAALADAASGGAC